MKNLIHIITLFNEMDIRYWLDGGWGVDALYGKQTRAHHDVDIDFDAEHTSRVLKALAKDGYCMRTDELPVRAELYSAKHGLLDIHPFEICPSGTIRQVNPEGGFFEFDPIWFTSVLFCGMEIPCISPAGQKAFHSGYPLREKDLHDLALLEKCECMDC